MNIRIIEGDWEEPNPSFLKLKQQLWHEATSEFRASQYHFFQMLPTYRMHMHVIVTVVQKRKQLWSLPYAANRNKGPKYKIEIGKYV